jgi:tetratricopeptide (TPR) repeat protein
VIVTAFTYDDYPRCHSNGTEDAHHAPNYLLIFAPNFQLMKPGLRRFLVFNRLYIAVALIALGFWIGFAATWWVAWIPFLIAVLMVVAHFMVGPMTLIQGYIEDGDMEGAQKLMERVKYPQLLYKPVRSSYYMLRANFSTMGDDLDKAESDLRKGLEGKPEKEFEGTAYLQLGAIAAKKGNNREAYEHLRKAVKIGLPDKDNEATAYLQLSGICMQRRDFRSAKMYFAKAKSCKPKNEQVLSQLQEMAKYMARIPG